jgi:signal transduction histidine kinase/ActR/RegA family two-component response regulator
MPPPSSSADPTAIGSAAARPAFEPFTGAAVDGLYLVRTLVVDADAATREMLVEAVGNRGHQTTVATSLEEAAVALATQKPDCLVLKLRQSWSVSLEAFLRAVATSSLHPLPHVLAVLLDDPPPRPLDWLARGVDDIVIGLARAQEFDSRLAVAERRIAQRRHEEETRHQAIAAARNFENLFHHSPSPVLVVAARDGLILEANPAAARLLSLPVHEIRDRFVSLLLPGLLGRDEDVQNWDDSAGPLRLTALSHRRADGATCDLEAEVGRCFWADRPALCLRLEEVGPARRAENDRVRHARLEATRAVAAGAASSLNDALTAIRGNIDLLAKQNTPRSEAQGLLENAGQACERAELSVRTLASLARSSQALTRRRRSDLRSLLSRWVSTALLSGKATIEFVADPELPPVDIDEASFREAVLALLQNAEDAMPQGGRLRVTVTPSSSASSPSHSWIAIEFTDTGEGIPQESIPRLCDPYFTTRAGHLGLGLTHVASIIEAHSAFLEIISSQGAGTTVRLLLPVPVAAHPSSHPEIPPAPQRPRGRILVMDDDVGIRVIVEKMLSLQGFEVYTVRDGSETITAYRRARELGAAFDVVLLDLDVRGGMGGRECIARLRGEFPDVKALLSTGFSDDQILENHREFGFSGVLTKPYNLERLVQTVSRLADA